MSNIIYIATSLDGYIAKSDGGIDWLMELPNPENSDYGFADFMDRIDGVLMGRNTYETVMNFDEWAYTKPLFVLTNSLNELPGKWAHKAEIIKGGDVKEVIAVLNEKGINNIYVDGGKTIQSFLAADLIDEMVITQVPILLGSGIPLFHHNPELKFEHAGTEVYNNGLVKSRYLRVR